MNKLRIAIISGSLVSGIVLSLLLNYYDFFTPAITENTYGIKGEVIRSLPEMLCPCPYMISFSAQKGVAIQDFFICKDSACIKQDTRFVLDPPKYSQARTAIKNENVPWHVGDNVDIHVKFSPLQYDGSVHYSDMNARLLDLGTSVVKRS